MSASRSRLSTVRGAAVAGAGRRARRRWRRRQMRSQGRGDNATQWLTEVVATTLGVSRGAAPSGRQSAAYSITRPFDPEAGRSHSRGSRGTSEANGMDLRASDDRHRRIAPCRCASRKARFSSWPVPSLARSRRTMSERRLSNSGRCVGFSSNRPRRTGRRYHSRKRVSCRWAAGSATRGRSSATAAAQERSRSLWLTCILPSKHVSQRYSISLRVMAASMASVAATAGMSTPQPARTSDSKAAATEPC